MKTIIISILLLFCMTTDTALSDKDVLNPIIDARILESLIHYESTWRHDVVSSAGAVGLMQIKPSTASMFGYSREDLFCPIKNIEAGSLYLKYLLDKYNGCIRTALAAYNCGPYGFKGKQVCANYANRILKRAYGEI